MKAAAFGYSEDRLKRSGTMPGAWRNKDEDLMKNL
jgi:hypothetical protein